MKRIFSQNTGLFWLATTVSLVLFAACNKSQSVTTVVTNEASHAVSNVRLEYTGGQDAIATLNAGESKTFKINAKGPSSLVLRFEDASGKRHEKLIDIYLTRGGKGNINVYIGADSEVRWKGATSL